MTAFILPSSQIGWHTFDLESPAVPGMAEQPISPTDPLDFTLAAWGLLSPNTPDSVSQNAAQPAGIGSAGSNGSLASLSFPRSLLPSLPAHLGRDILVGVIAIALVILGTWTLVKP